MDILSFSKITKPIYEGGTTIDCRPRGKWLIEIRDTDGTIRRPFGDTWIDNLFINRYANGQLGGTGQLSGLGWSSQGSGNTPVFTQAWTFTSLFYDSKSSIAVGSGTTPVQVTDTTLANQIRFDSTPFVTGNSISWNQTTGDIIYAIKEQFPAETGSVTYNEAGIRITGGSGSGAMNGLLTDGSSGLLNRVVFPVSINLSAGQQLIITIAITIPSLASAAGKTITIAAQNGVNISGVLKCIGSQDSMAGGFVTANGTASGDNSHPLLFNPTQIPVALLSTKTAFDTLGTNPTWGTTNEVSGTWQSYTTDSRFRDIGFTWGNGTPATNTNFQSILFRKVTTSGAMGGYQLLLNNQMTKVSTATLSIALRFTV